METHGKKIRLSPQLRLQLWSEAATTATKIGIESLLPAFNDDADGTYIIKMMIVISRITMIVIVRRMRMEMRKCNWSGSTTSFASS